MNTDQRLVEEALPGVDVEVGTRLNFLDGVTDVTRVYVGGYHFEGDVAENVTGYRTRIASDITSDFQVGARYQNDDVRGSQTYLEATVRFPWGNKKSYKEEGLRSRLDESPERDIDIVHNEKVLDEGLSKPLLNAATGATQNVVHVDNTAGGGGDGSIEAPYNTLAAAEGAAVANDLIYVHRGDGTTAGQANGITLDDQGQMLAGSGVNLLFSKSRFATSNGQDVTGGILVATETAAPVITNGAGNGIDITADDVFVSGVTVDGATQHGIHSFNADNTIVDNVSANNNVSLGVIIEADASLINSATIQNSSVDNNGTGLYIRSVNAGVINNASLNGNESSNHTFDGIVVVSDGVGSSVKKASYTNNYSHDNATSGLLAYARNDGEIDEVALVDNTADSNGSYGLYAYALSGGNIGAASFGENTASNSTLDGFLLRSSGVGSSLSVNLSGNIADNNRNGFQTLSQNGASLVQANFTRNIADSNTSSGFYMESDGAGSTIASANFIDNTADSNTTNGFYALAENAGSIGAVSFEDNTATNNTFNGLLAAVDGVASTLTSASFVNNIADNNDDYGLLIHALNNGDLNTATFESNTSANNTIDGFLVQSSAGGTIQSVSVDNNNADSNDRYGFLVNVTGGSEVDNIDFEGNASTNNANNGFMSLANGAGSTINTIGFTDNIADSNANNGFVIFGVTDGDIGAATLEGNTATNNVQHGVQIRDNSVAGGIVADLGGGALGSTGGNRVFNNTAENLAVDLDGAELKAEGNWWGDASGLLPAEVLLQDASTVDSDPFLAVDPN